jgi:hypothetical protein
VIISFLQKIKISISLWKLFIFFSLCHIIWTLLITVGILLYYQLVPHDSQANPNSIHIKHYKLSMSSRLSKRIFTHVMQTKLSLNPTINMLIIPWEGGHGKAIDWLVSNYRKQNKTYFHEFVIHWSVSLSEFLFRPIHRTPFNCYLNFRQKNLFVIKRPEGWNSHEAEI